MWIKFDLQGMRFNLKIENYRPHQDVDGEWTKDSFEFKFQDIINYKKDNYEAILSCEIDDLIKYLDELLNDKMNEPKDYTCIEPDFEFVFSPKFDVRNDPNCLYAKPGTEIIDIDLQLKVNLWDDGLTNNYFSTTFGREEIEQLYTYLKLIAHRIQITDDNVQQLIKNGIIYGDVKE